MMRALVAFLFLIFASSVVWIAAQAYDAAQERQKTYRYIANALTPMAARQSHVTWEAPLKPLIRPFTEYDAEAVGLAMGEAWQVLAIAQDTGNAELIADKFTGVAQERVLLSISDAVSFGGRMTVLAQTARPIFFHKDGSMFQAEVEMTVTRYLPATDGSEGVFQITKDTGIATLMNESNGWRIYSYELRSSTPITVGPALWSGRLNGINYYPAETPWRDFWAEFDEAEIARDFEAIAGLGANAVRFFLTRDTFVGDDSEASVAKLERFLELAGVHELRVVPTLFDLKQDFGLGSWADDALYLERVMPVLARSNAVAFVDLKNEPDLDFAHHGQARMMAWLQSMIVLSRVEAPDLALTIGWSDAAYASLLAQDLDVVTYHDYAALEGTEGRLKSVRSEVGKKPVLITEIGESSYEVGFSFPGSDQKQAERLGDRLKHLNSADGTFVWTLHDFPKVDPTVVGRSPWVKRLQGAFGLIGPDGDEKPSAAFVRAHFLASD